MCALIMTSSQYSPYFGKVRSVFMEVLGQVWIEYWRRITWCLFLYTSHI